MKNLILNSLVIMLTIFTYDLLFSSVKANELSVKPNNHNISFLNSKPSSKKLPFSEAVKVGNTLYMSGKIGTDPKTKKLAIGGIKAEAKQALNNMTSVLTKYGYTTKDVVKCLIMLVDINDYQAFNEVYSEHFSAPYPARSLFAAKELVIDAQVEVECIAAKAN